MMKHLQVLLVLAILGIETKTDAKNKTPRESKSYYPPSASSKVSFGNFHHGFGDTYLSPSSTISHESVESSISPTIQTTAFTSSAESSIFQHTSNTITTSSYSDLAGTVSTVDDDYLKLHQNMQTNQRFLYPSPFVPPPLPPQRKTGILIPSTLSFGTTHTLEDILEQEWNAFKITFNKSYNSYEEERQRKEIFIENRNKVAKFNQEYGNGKHSFVQKLNEYGDMLNHEFNSFVNGLNKTRKGFGTEPPARKSSAFIPAANVALPTYVDWRELGAVTSVRRQGRCGACYAFASAAALEGQKYRRTGQLPELSPQNLIDCTDSYSNDGCQGGLTEYAFEYIRDNRGIDTENAYPFEEKDGQQCRYREDGYGAHNTGYVLLDEGDEKALEVAVATIGPVAVGFDAHHDSFQFYSNGVYFEPKCSSSIDQLNHAVLVVGYGTEPSGEQYWLIKNSYGPEWGIGGYMKLSKFSNNHCGISTYASYPLV